MEALGSPAAAVTSSFGGWHLAAVVVLCAIGAAEVWGVRSLGRLVRTARKVAESPCGGECEEKTKRRTSPSGVRGYGPMTWLPSHPSGGKGQGGAVTFAAGAEASALLSDVKDGVVSSVVNFGAFVDLGGMDGLVHVSELSWKHVDHPSSVVQVGDEIEVEVLSAVADTAL